MKLMINSFWRARVHSQDSKMYLTEVNKQEICLKMLDFAISETRIFKIFWMGGGGGACPQTPLVNPLLHDLHFD